ncbi:dihydroxyacetone kinase [Crepidotus variabilis]|uniref:Dihydroxyacetone kinase n=1 Tax=Crepidotus variabilis TaxID=179855 RepID=A0A9P6EKH9_9AGAR|nr:dihydroxyacetone kinase [Crepidotus variabilis]
MSVQSKHLLNTPESLVVESLRGVCATNPEVALDEANKILFQKAVDRSKVALVCGGGSGHEPAHSGFVGKGMLSAAVCGNIFASPSPSQVRNAINLVDNQKGTLIVVKNYTGDVLNFGLAKEQFGALHPEKSNSLEFVIVGDDVAVGREQGKIVGRRGLAGTVLVYKVAGALAQSGASLNEVYEIATWVAGRLATIGVSLGHTHVPGTGTSESDISTSEIEIGMGIHNESGHKRVSPIPKLSELIPQLLDLLTSTTDSDRSFVPFKGRDEVVVLVNNLGGLSELELGGIVAEVRKELDARGYGISRLLSGTYMTSLNMPGFSITLFMLPEKNSTSSPSIDLILSLLDEETDAPGWKCTSKAVVSSLDKYSFHSKTEEHRNPGQNGLPASDPNSFIDSIKKAAQALINAEPEITKMDTIAGDGDCGLTLKAGAEAVLSKAETGELSGSDVAQAMISISQIAEDKMGGTSGALYSIFFSALAQGLHASGDSNHVSSQGWTKALHDARDKLYTYTRARPPSRTLVDPLDAFISTLSKSFDASVKAAADAAENTRDVEAKAGRSAYVEGDRLKNEKIPDPGAWGVKVILENI